MAKKKKHHRAKKTYVTNPSVRSGRSVVASAAKPPHNWKRKKVYKWNAPRKYRKNPSESPKDIAIMVGSAVATGIAAPKLISKLPGSNLVKNLGMIGGGLAMAYFGRKKSYVLGPGIGLIYAGASRAIINQFPTLAGDNEMSQDDAENLMMQLANQDELAGPLAGHLAGPLAGPMYGNLNNNMI